MEGGQAWLLCKGQRCWHGPGRGSWSHAVLTASRRAEKTLGVGVSCHVCSQKRQTRQEGRFKTHIPALPLDFRCEVPTRPRPHRQAHSQVWAGGRQVGGPVSRAPHGLVHKGVQRTFRGHRWAFHGSPRGLPVLRLGPWKGSGLEEAPRGPRLVQTQALGSGCLDPLRSLSGGGSSRREVWLCPVKHPPLQAPQETQV